MHKEKILLGKTAEHGVIYLFKHSWDCDWYWGFGYVGNNHCHFHFKSFLGQETDIDKIFEETPLTQLQWWVLRDLFIQAYALKEAAEVYQHGGRQIDRGTCQVIGDKKKAEILNHDLELVLRRIWQLLQGWSEDYDPDLIPYTKEQFLKDNKVSIRYVGEPKNQIYEPFGDDEYRWVFKVKLTANDENYQFSFGQSEAAGATPPTLDDVLSCMTKDDPGSFEEFCDRYGYDYLEAAPREQRRLKANYCAVCIEFEAMQRLFGGDGLEKLREFY